MATVNYTPRTKPKAHPIPLSLIMGEYWKGWAQWTDDCDEFHQQRRKSNIVDNNMGNIIEHVPNPVVKKNGLNSEKYNGLTLAERLNMEKDESSGSSDASYIGSHSESSSVYNNGDSDTESSTTNRDSICRTPISIMSVSDNDLPAGSDPILNPKVTNRIEQDLGEDIPPLFMDDGTIDTDTYELVEELDPVAIYEPDRLYTLGEKLEMRVYYYRNKLGTGPEVMVKRYFRTLLKSVARRRYELKPFGEAKYDNPRNLSQYAPETFMEYPASYINEQVNRGVLNLDIDSSLDAKSQTPILISSGADSHPYLNQSLNIYNQRVKTNIKNAQLSNRSNDDIDQPTPIYIRAPAPVNNKATLNGLTGRGSGGRLSSGARNAFMPPHLRNHNRSPASPVSNIEIDFNMHPRERRRLLREMEENTRRSNYKGRSLGGRRDRLGSNRSHMSSGSGGGSDKYGMRLYGFQSLEDFDHNDIRQLMQKYGVDRMGRIFIPKDRQTGMNRNFAFINFNTEEEVTNALDTLSNAGRIMFDHVIIKAQRSNPRET